VASLAYIIVQCGLTRCLSRLSCRAAPVHLKQTDILSLSLQQHYLTAPATPGHTTPFLFDQQQLRDNILDTLL
jgi:hypothetical protein